MFLLDLGLTAKNMHSIMPCPLPLWLEHPQMPDSSSEHKLPFCTCSLRSLNLKKDMVQLFSRKPCRKVIPLRRHVPHLLTWQDTVFSQEERRLRGLHLESVKNWALFQENSPLQQRHEQSQSYSAKHAVQQTTSGISIVALKRRGGNISNTSKHPQVQMEFNMLLLALSVSLDNFVI